MNNQKTKHGIEIDVLSIEDFDDYDNKDEEKEQFERLKKELGGEIDNDNII